MERRDKRRKEKGGKRDEPRRLFPIDIKSSGYAIVLALSYCCQHYWHGQHIANNTGYDETAESEDK